MRIFIGAFGVLMLAASTSQATMRGSAVSGHAYYFSDSACFERDFGKIKNVCADRRYWVIDIPIDNGTDSLNGIARIFGKSGSSFSGNSAATECILYYLNPNGTVLGSAGGVLPTAANWKTLNAGFPPGIETTAQLECLVAPQGAGSGNWLGMAEVQGS